MPDEQGMKQSEVRPCAVVGYEAGGPLAHAFFVACFALMFAALIVVSISRRADAEKKKANAVPTTASEG